MNIRPFEITLIGIFAVAAIAGLIFMSMYSASPSDEARLYGDRVVIWGTLDQRVFENFLTQMTQGNSALSVISYRQVDARNFEYTLVNAIAEGRSPDLLIIPHSMLVQLRAKLTPISYQTITERNFRDAYMDGAEIFMRSDGIYGIPLAIDPMVMYWNRDILASSGFAEPPRTWEGLVSQYVPTITQLTHTRDIQRSTLAFGEYRNVLHAKKIFSMLLLQTGNPIVDEKGPNYQVTFGNSTQGVSSGETVLNFYTQFALPTRELYSWNRSKNLDRNEFSSGTLGIYFGPGSEWQTIERENPNLNYDVARVPQGAGATTPRTYGDFYAFAIPRASQKPQGAYAVALLFSSPLHAQKLSSELNMAPAQRSLYNLQTNNPFIDVLYQSALVARGWLDPNPQASDIIFRDMIEQTTSGVVRNQNTVIDAVQKLESLF